MPSDRPNGVSSPNIEIKPTNVRMISASSDDIGLFESKSECEADQMFIQHPLDIVHIILTDINSWNSEYRPRR
jgi:hypothetical protein